MEWPFSASIPKTLKVGDQIEIEATIAEDTNIFTVNLVGEYESGYRPHNVIYHHKMMFDEERTVLNSKMDGSWGEERHSNEMHVTPGDTFTMLILIKDVNVITAYFNDIPHSDYEHEFNLEDIKYFQIWNGLGKLKSIKITFAD